MLLNLNANPKHFIYSIIFHIILGCLIPFNSFILVIWFYVVFLWFLYNIITKPVSRESYLIFMIFYLSSFEVIGRMARVSPFIPQELSKYLLPLLFTLGLILTRKKYNLGIFMLFLILPGFFYDSSNSVNFSNIVFFGFGPITLCLSIAFFYQKKLSLDFVFNCLKLLLYTCILVLFYAFIKTPDYDDIKFSLGANFETTAGFGSNQVSNILGLGSFIIILHILMNKIISGHRLLDLVLLFLFIFQGLLTFSRGGVYSLLVGVFSFIFLVFFSNNTISKIYKKRLLVFVFLASFLSFSLFKFTNNLTNNLLSLRYSGETYLTQSGLVDKDINKLTSSRTLIMLDELKIWNENLFFGNGVGSSYYLSTAFNSLVSSHTEFTRLLAEHGFLGIVFIIFWLQLIFKISSDNSGYNKALLVSFFVFSFFMSLHSAMRVFITPLLTGFATIIIFDKKYTQKN